MTKIKESSFNDLKCELEKYLEQEEIVEIEEAYKFAKSKHEGQYRRTGEEFISHPICVAYILTSIKADKETIIAALLHDTIEDTDTTKNEIEKKFGDVVANLVDKVTKINNIHVSTDNEYLTNYYKKIIVGMSEDVRVIIIKLADRLHNMRTLQALPVDSQKRIAKATIEILAPIGDHLGIHKIKSELEDLSLKYLKPDVYYDIVEKLNANKLTRDDYVKLMMNEVSSLLNKNGIKHEIKGRSKSIYSIYKKLSTGRSFNNIYDLLALRILVDRESDCYQALGLIHSKYKPVNKRFKDFIAMPKSNLYQTLHTTVFGLDGNFFEIQIRTHDMDDIAENGIASHWAYKEKKSAAVEMQNVTEQKLQFYKSIIELNEEKLTNEDFMDTIKNDILSNGIYVYTPKGDVFELPIGSTPVDFAYKIHSQVGDKTTGAIVNDSMVPLSYELNDSDIIRIITNNNSNGPSREWLDFVKTNGARDKIRSFLNRNTREDYINEGKTLLEKELRKKKVSISKFLKEQELQAFLKSNKLTNLEDLYLNIGNNKFSAKSLVKQIIKEEEIKEIAETITEIKKTKTESDNDIIVAGSKNIQIHISACCMPVPGDEIIGYITKTSGISIHRRDCINIDSNDDRLIDVSWNEVTRNTYLSDLIIYSNTLENILLDITQIAATCKVSLENINIMNKEGKNTYLIGVYVKNLDELNDFILKLTKFKNVSTVERMIK